MVASLKKRSRNFPLFTEQAMLATPMRRLLPIVFMSLSTVVCAAQQIPAALLGKSVVVNWTDIRVEREVSAAGTTQSPSDFTISIYVSSQGHIFSLYDRRHSQKDQSANIDRQVGSVGSIIADSRRLALSWQFENGNLSADQQFIQGARRVSIDFDSSYKRCAVKVIYGKGAGNENIRYLSRESGRELELLESRITSTKCRVLHGNVLAD